jgi:hypothetical protein
VLGVVAFFSVAPLLRTKSPATTTRTFKLGVRNASAHANNVEVLEFAPKRNAAAGGSRFSGDGQAFLDRDPGVLYIRTTFRFRMGCDRFNAAFTNSGDKRLRIVMSKTRKSGNRYGETPSTRDKLSGGFLEALAKDWAEHGPEVIQQIRLDNPVKYGELIARLVPMDANLPPASDFSQCQSMQDIGLKLLQQVGLDAPTENQIERAIAANNTFVATLEAIRDEAVQ